MVRIFIFALLLLFSTAAQAGSFTVSDEKLCQIRLDGEIEIGDNKKFLPAIGKARALLEAKTNTPFEIPRFVGETPTPTMCLNSPGGSFGEALAIIDTILETGGIATVVDANKECLSACALIFMFGHVQAYHSDKYFDRRLHVTGKLGFHAPFQRTEQSTNNQRLIDKIYLSGVQAIGKLIEIDRNEFLARGLIIEFLKRGPDDFLFVDNVDRAGEWSIEIIGHAPLKQITNKNISQACDNIENWAEKRKTREFYINKYVGKEQAKLKVMTETKSKVTSVLKGYGNEGGEFCVLKAQRMKSGDFLLDVSIVEAIPSKTEINEFNIGEGRLLVEPGFGSIKPSWITMPPETKISALSP
ncbi:MAG: hypothetical protein QM651_17970 [Rhodoblastus sp.]